MRRNIIILFALLLSAQAAWSRTFTTWIQGSRGRLSAVLQVPDVKKGTRVPMVIICHGFTSQKNELLLKLLSDSLYAKGIASVRFDFNGHGESEGSFTGMTVPNEIEDAKCVYRYVRSLDYVGAIAMAGHSQGGVVTAMTVGQLGADSISAAVLMSPAAALREDALRGTIFGKTYNAVTPPDSVDIGNGRFLGKGYILTAQKLPIYETAKRYEGPTLIIHGTADTVVPYTYGERFHEEMRYSWLQLVNGCDHIYSGRQNEAVGIAARFLARVLK
ncbi:MAG: alpha/beta hydrolase [Prevotella sp.]